MQMPLSSPHLPLPPPLSTVVPASAWRVRAPVPACSSCCHSPARPPFTSYHVDDSPSPSHLDTYLADLQLSASCLRAPIYTPAHSRSSPSHSPGACSSTRVLPTTSPPPSARLCTPAPTCGRLLIRPLERLGWMPATILPSLPPSLQPVWTDNTPPLLHSIRTSRSTLALSRCPL